MLCSVMSFSDTAKIHVLSYLYVCWRLSLSLLMTKEHLYNTNLKSVWGKHSYFAHKLWRELQGKGVAF